MSSSEEDTTEEAKRAMFNEEFLRKVMQQKAAEPGMFVSNWEEDEAGIIPEAEPGSNKAKILKAAENGDATAVNELLNIDPSLVAASDSDEYTPLHRASYNDHADVIELLLRRGANVNARTECGWQPIHCAAKWGNSNALRILVSLGSADVNARTDGGLTPLHLAASCKDPDGVETVRLLLSHPSIAVDIVSNGGETPRDVARQTSAAMIDLFEANSNANAGQRVENMET